MDPVDDHERSVGAHQLTPPEAALDPMEVEAASASASVTASSEELDQNALAEAIAWYGVYSDVEEVEVERKWKALQDELQVKEEKQRLETRSREMNQLAREIMEKPAVENSKKMLLVLDLNGVLCRVDHLPFGPLPIGPYGLHPVPVRCVKRCLYLRPGVGDFLAKVCQHFHVMIWSCMVRDRTVKITDCLLGEIGMRGLISPSLILGGEDCSRLLVSNDKVLTLPGNPEKELMLKALAEQVWTSHRFFSFLPDMRPTPSNTLLVDDTPRKGLLNPAFSGIYLPTFGAEDDQEDYLMHTLLPWLLLGLKHFGGPVPQYVKRNQLGKPAFTPLTHPVQVNPDPEVNPEILNYPANIHLKDRLVRTYGIRPSLLPLSELHYY